MKNKNTQQGFTQRNTRQKRVGRADSTGFTIIELLVATTVFSIVLMVILASFLQIGRMFYKGISVSNTQETARSVVESISDDMKLSQSFIPTANYNTTAKYFCVGDHRYVYNIDHVKVGQGDVTGPQPVSPRGIIESTVNGCPPPSSAAGTNVQQLLGPDMQLNDFSVACPTLNNCNIHIHIVFYGFDDSVFNSSSHPDDTSSDHSAAINDADAYCSGSLLSTQFCAVADIDSTVAMRY
jgi:prepilin-type N-terminal cleavage/methylation domain-containing protein